MMEEGEPFARRRPGEGRSSLKSVRYSIPGLAGDDATGSAAFELDLQNALTVLDGVGQVDIDHGSYLVTVHFDPNYMDLKTLAYILEGTGYPVDGTEDVT